jgi:SAM-dependent methyltransferase
VLDVGCGTGSTTLALARKLGPGALCLGADLSAPMVALARERAQAESSSARFEQADVQTHAFEPARFERLVSRFGVMFFDDPVRAFANLHRAAAAGATLDAFAWRSAAENPFMTAVEREAAALLPDVPPRAAPGRPGQFAFADAGHVERILRDSGWTGVELQRADVPCSYPASERMRLACGMGPVGRALQVADGATRALVLEAADRAIAPYVKGDHVHYVAACWRILAKA